jgi:hypothetical protein
MGIYFSFVIFLTIGKQVSLVILSLVFSIVFNLAFPKLRLKIVEIITVWTLLSNSQISI